MKVTSLTFAVLASVSLASCTTTGGDSQLAAAKTLDTICAAEPAVYASFSLVAGVKDVPASTIRKIDAPHDAVTAWCTDRPDNLVAIIVLASTTYAQILVANEKYGD